MANYEQDMARIRRRKMLAQALQMQGAQGTQGQMAGGIYTAPSPFAQLASGIAGVAGGYLGGKADLEETDFKEQQRKQIAEALRGFTMGQPQAGPVESPTATPGIPGVVAGQAGSPSGPPAQQPKPPDPRRAAALAVLQGLPLEQQQAIVGSQAVSQLFPKPQEGFTLGAGEKRFDASGKEIAGLPAKPEATPAEIQGYNLYSEQQRAAGRPPLPFLDYQLAQKRAGATNVSTNVHAEKSLYGTLAEKQAGQYSDQYAQAQKAPELIARSQRVKDALAADKQTITGVGANWILTGAKIANQMGFDTGNAAADTESLARELAGSALDAIKSSGLGAGSGFSNADRDFLEKVAGGTITLEAETLRRTADLNEKAARSTIRRWNETAGRLKPEFLQQLGMTPIEMTGQSSDMGGLSDEDLLKRLRGER